jgi:RecA-family ATPase
MKAEKIDANYIDRTQGPDVLRAMIDSVPDRKPGTGRARQDKSNGDAGQSTHTDAPGAEQTRARRPFTLYDELTTDSNKNWLIHNLLGAGEASCMYGKPGDGKSVLAQDLGLHVAANAIASRLWHGREVRGGAVVYVALERKKLVERRAIAFRKKHGLKNLPFAVVGGVYDFRSPKVVQELVDIIKQVEAATGQPVALVIIDTLSRAMAGGDENSPKDMGAIVARQARCRAPELTSCGCTILRSMPNA